MKKIKVIKLKPMRGIYDSDWDGVPNDRDCQWWNPHKQDSDKPESYIKTRESLFKSKYFDFRGGIRAHPERYPPEAKFDPHGVAMKMAKEYVDEVMPL